jgi:hypothetical protein
MLVVPLCGWWRASGRWALEGSSDWREGVSRGSKVGHVVVAVPQPAREARSQPGTIDMHRPVELASDFLQPMSERAIHQVVVFIDGDARPLGFTWAPTGTSSEGARSCHRSVTVNVHWCVCPCAMDRARCALHVGPTCLIALHMVYPSLDGHEISEDTVSGLQLHLILTLILLSLELIAARTHELVLHVLTPPHTCKMCCTRSSS